MKQIGGSESDEWNNILLKQVIDCLWIKNSSSEERDRQFVAAVAALVAFKPADELESMLAAQLIACHNAAMECFRRATHGEQTFVGRSENLSQANKLSRSFATQQKVTVEHIHINKGGQAIVGNVTTAGGFAQKPADRVETDPSER